MRARSSILIIPAVAAIALAMIEPPPGDAEYTTDFMIEHCEFEPDGRNLYWSLEPGTFSRLEGEDDGAELIVEITVLNDTKSIRFTTLNGVEMNVRCRIIEEREWEDGELIEVSRNFFARCKRTGHIFYFGEDVDIYENGQIVSHDGAWRAGRNDAQPGIIMPSVFLLGARYFQEVAEADEAMDRARHTEMGLTVQTPFGEFTDCVKIVETTPVEPNSRSIKIYAPGVGLIFDDGIELTDHQS